MKINFKKPFLALDKSFVKDQKGSVILMNKSLANFICDSCPQLEPIRAMQIAQALFDTGEVEFVDKSEIEKVKDFILTHNNLGTLAKAQLHETIIDAINKPEKKKK